MMQTAKMLLATAALLQLTTGWTANAYAVPDDEDVTWIRKEVEDDDFEVDPEPVRAGNGIRPMGLSYEDIKAASGSVRASMTKGTNDCTCGIANKDSRIIGGSKAATREFPWIVQVWTQTDQGWFTCGGSIISSQHIVTAAHCTKFSDMQTKKVVVLYGVDNVASTYAEQWLEVETYYDHPSYDPDPDQNAHDITVLKLKNKLTFDTQVSPICLPDASTDYADMAAVVAGWGMTSSPNGTSSEDLLKVDMTFGSNDYCNEKSSLFEEEYMICTKYTPGMDSCQGDSGGPVMVEIDGKYQLVGAVSFGPHPCATEGPGTNTRITAYLSWINGILSENGDAACE